MIHHLKTDVLIIGGGAASAIAAIEIQPYHKVVIVSKDQLLGGASIQTSGGISLPGIAGEPLDLFCSDTLTGGCQINDIRLVKKLATEGAGFISYMEKLGVVFDRNPDKEHYRIFKKTEGHSVMRNYMDRRNFHEFARVLKSRVVNSDITLMEHSFAYQVYVQDNRIIYVTVYDLINGDITVIWPEIVILATGGYGRLYSISDNSLSLTGEGHAIALECGARLKDMEMIQFIPLGFPYPEGMRGAFMGMCSMFGPEVKLYNRFHERFMEKYDPVKKEFSTRDTVARGIYSEIQAGRGTEHNTIIVDPTDNSKDRLELYKSSAPTAYTMIEKVFGSKAASWEQPFEAIPSQHFCMGGIEIDADCRTGCENLLACGEVTGGVHGANRLGGNALLETAVFGKVSAETAKDLLIKMPEQVPCLNENRIDSEIQKSMDRMFKLDGKIPSVVKKELSEVMWDKCGIVRSETQLLDALRSLGQIEKDLSSLAIKRGFVWNMQLQAALELPHMIKTAKAVVLSALGRKESRGAHYRSDFTARDEQFTGNMIIDYKNETIGSSFEKLEVNQ